MIDKETGKVIIIPSFITPEGEVIFIDPSKINDIGEYEVKVCSTIENSLLTTECISFEITVLPIPDGKTYTTEPEFMVNLSD